MSKKRSAVAAAFIVIGVVVLGLAAAVYAKYIASFTATGSATVAKWAFSTDNTSGTVTCVLDKTYDANTLVAGKIAPGTSGKCPIQISNANTEVGVDYEIKLPSTVANQPTNLKFYSDADHNTPITSSDPITGNLRPNAAATTVYVYWEWPYETGAVTNGVAAGDSADTTDGAAAATMTLEFEVTGTQVQPVAQ